MPLHAQLAVSLSKCLDFIRKEEDISEQASYNMRSLVKISKHYSHFCRVNVTQLSLFGQSEKQSTKLYLVLHT